MIRRRSCVVLAVLPLLATSLAQAALVSTNPFLGITLDSYVETTPRINRINVAVIDLSAPGLRFQITPSNGAAAGETNTETTRNYVSRVNAQLGINTSFFNLGGTPNDNIGILASNGDLISPNEGDGRPGFNISATNLATVFTSSGAAGTYTTSPNIPTLYNASTGSDMLITNGTVRTSYPNTAFTNENPRTAVATTTDNKLLLVTVDGRQAGFSEGMKLLELGQFLKAKYPTIKDAVNMDGGGSTTMAADYYYDGQGTLVLNNPQGERSNGANLAIFANPIGPPPPPPPPQVAVLDSFKNGEGRFNSAATSGSNRGLATTGSTLTFEPTGGVPDDKGDTGNQKITVALDPSTAYNGFVLRHLSGGAVPASNLLLNADGFIGFWLKTTDANLQASLVIDDTTGANERGTWLNVIADGQWHLYEWDFDDAADWENFNAGNGEITAATVTLDALYFQSTVEAPSYTFYIDNVFHNEAGSLAGIPEPTTALLPTPALLALSRRRQ